MTIPMPTASDGSGSGNSIGELISFGGRALWMLKIGKALDLDGAGSMVVVEDSASLNGLSHEASIAFWMRLRSYGKGKRWLLHPRIKLCPEERGSSWCQSHQ